MAKSIMDALAPLHLSSKICGYSIFSINRLDFSIEFKRIDVLLQIWIIVVNCCLNCFLWDTSQRFPLHKSNIISETLPIILSGCYVLYLCCVIASMVMRKKQSILIESICQIDEMVSFSTTYLSKTIITHCSWESWEFVSTTIAKSVS